MCSFGHLDLTFFICEGAMVAGLRTRPDAVERPCDTAHGVTISQGATPPHWGEREQEETSTGALTHPGSPNNFENLPLTLKSPVPLF